MQDTLKPNEICTLLDAPRHALMPLIHRGVIKAEKKKGRYYIRRRDFEAFRRANDKKTAKLKKDYIDLWKQGLTVARLKERTREDMEKRGIICFDPSSFAEWTIYDHLMANNQERAKEGAQNENQI